MTLLQNLNNVLPLNRKMTVAVLGPNANDSVMQWGNYNGFPSHTSTLLSALRQRLPASQVIYEPVCARTEGIQFNSLFNQCRTKDGQGFAVAYWNNDKMDGTPVAHAQLATPFQLTTQGATVFAPGVALSHFSGKYTTTFTPKKSGNISFRMQTNGRVAISINGKKVSEKYNVRTTANVYSMDVKAGETYQITLDFMTVRDNPYFNFDLVQEQPLDINALLARIAPADVIVFAGGIAPSLEGEEMPVNAPGFKGGDRTDIQLPAIQRNIIKELKQSGKPVVLVHFSGSAMALGPETKDCAAILQAWYPGQAGGDAVADVLFGDYNPAGRLPVTFYKDTTQLPDFENYLMAGRTYRYMKQEPLFAFGYGLSYTTFDFGQAKANQKQIAKNQVLKLTIPVKNSGRRDGEEVVQVYLRRPSDTEGPNKALRAFKRVSIAKGQTADVKISIPYSDFNWFDTESNTMRPLPGKYEVLYGSSSRDCDLKTMEVELN
jgi:beta-glucosidase